MRAERNVFGQLVLSIEHTFDLELTSSLPLEPVPWPLSIPDCMPTKTDKSNFLQFLESHIEPLIDRPFHAANIIDDYAIQQGLTAIPDTFEEQVESLFNQSPKAEHVCFVTDT